MLISWTFLEIFPSVCSLVDIDNRILLAYQEKKLANKIAGDSLIGQFHLFLCERPCINRRYNLYGPDLTLSQLSAAGAMRPKDQQWVFDKIHLRQSLHFEICHQRSLNLSRYFSFRSFGVRFKPPISVKLTKTILVFNCLKLLKSFGTVKIFSWHFESVHPLQIRNLDFKRLSARFHSDGSRLSWPISKLREAVLIKKQNFMK